MVIPRLRREEKNKLDAHLLCLLRVFLLRCSFAGISSFPEEHGNEAVAAGELVSCPARSTMQKICLVTLDSILDTRPHVQAGI